MNTKRDAERSHHPTSFISCREISETHERVGKRQLYKNGELELDRSHESGEEVESNSKDRLVKTKDSFFPVALNSRVTGDVGGR